LVGEMVLKQTRANKYRITKYKRAMKAIYGGYKKRKI
jgi:hypothetical protein